MTLQRIKLPVFFYVFLPILQQVKVAKENMLSTNYQPKHALLEILQPNLLHRLSEYN